MDDESLFISEVGTEADCEAEIRFTGNSLVSNNTQKMS